MDPVTGGREDIDKVDSTSGQTPKSEEGKETQPEQGGRFDHGDRHGWLGRHLRSLYARMDGAMHSFRLAGTNRTVHDRRHIHEGHKDRAERHSHHHHHGRVDSGSAKEIREGRLSEVRKKVYENFLAERKLPTAERKGTDQKERQLSEFEKLIVERFENSRVLEKMTPDGKAKFLTKTVEQWRAFFQKFLGRTVSKSVDMTEVQEFVYRGYVKKGEAKAVVISDIILGMGRTDKFARFAILYQKLSSLLSQLIPGDTLSKQAIAESLLSEKLMYLALNPPSAEAEVEAGQKAKLGMFMSEATETRIAKELGFGKGTPSEAHGSRLGKKGKKMGGFGLGKLFAGEEGAMEEGQGRFMPWWQWGNLKKPGGFTLKRAFYSAVFIAFILVILLLLDRFLLGK